MPSRLGIILAAALVATASLAGAQAPSIPALPSAGFIGDLSPTTGQYEFAGCRNGPVEFVPGPGEVEGTAFCVRGILTLGFKPFFPGQPVLQGKLVMTIDADARLGSAYTETGDLQLVTGILTSAACPLGCAAGIAFGTPVGGYPTQTYFSQVVSLDPTSGSVPPSDLTSVFVPQRITTHIGYTLPPPAPICCRVLLESIFPLTPLAVTTVPEPGTWALMATGLLGVMGVARRKRTASV